MRYPERLLTDDEEVLAQFRPHWRVLLPSIGSAMILAALVGVAFAALERSYPWFALAGAVALWLLMHTTSLVTWWFTNYVLTTERIIVRSGMVARSGTEIPLENINNVLFSQGIIERLLRYGDVLIESAGSQGQSRLRDIPDPEAFQSEVYHARELRSLHFQTGGRWDTASSGPRDVVAQLEALANLRERGHLTAAEFEARKRILLAQGTTRDAPTESSWPHPDDDQRQDGPYFA